ncbi:MAG: hypothetical protein WDM94_07220 [Bauldia sp.]
MKKKPLRSVAYGFWLTPAELRTIKLAAAHNDESASAWGRRILLPLAEALLAKKNVAVS